MKRKYLLTICLLPLLSVYAQESDFVTWSKLKVQHKVASAVELAADVELRTRNDLREVDRWSMGLGAGIDLLSWLKGEVGYEVHYRNRGADGWKFRHRYYIGASGTLKTGNWTFSLRERIQHTFDGRGTNEFRLRTRLKAAYRIGFLSPYVSLEQYHGLGNDEWFRATRFRARGGAEFKLSSRWKADLYYCYQHESKKDLNVLGVEFNYKF